MGIPKYWEGGWWLPEVERHLQEHMTAVNARHNDRLTYQRNKYVAALALCKHRRVAIDVGAHVGLWSWQMAEDFECVYAFEPIIEHRECFKRNLRDTSNVKLSIYAIGETEKNVAFEAFTPHSSGDTGVQKGGEYAGHWPMMPLDYLQHWFQYIDFIKIDCEGYESFVIEGAEAVIKKHRPVIIVEQKGRESTYYNVPKLHAVNLLESYGYVSRGVIAGDYIMVAE